MRLQGLLRQDGDTYSVLLRAHCIRRGDLQARLGMERGRPGRGPTSPLPQGTSQRLCHSLFSLAPWHWIWSVVFTCQKTVQPISVGVADGLRYILYEATLCVNKQTQGWGSLQQKGRRPQLAIGGIAEVGCPVALAFGSNFCQAQSTFGFCAIPS